MKHIIILLSLLLMLTSCEFTAEEVKPTIKLVTVALSYKGSGVRELPNTLNDQRDFINQIELLCEKANYPLECYTFTEDSNFTFNGSEAGRTFTDEIKTLFTDTLLSSSQSKDITIFYYSGHGDKDGSMLVGLEHTASFINADDSFNDIVQNINNRLTIEQLKEYTASLNGKKLIILDSCYSGKVVSNPNNAIKQDEILKIGFEKLFSQEKIENRNTWYMTASKEDEESLEVSEFGHGVFTYYMLQGLGFDVNNNIATSTSPLGIDNEISLNELFHYIDTYIDKGNWQHTQKGMSTLDLVLFSFD